MNFNDCIEILEENQKRRIPFHYLNHVAFEAGGGWISYPSSVKSAIFIHENSDSRHHLVFWGSGFSDRSTGQQLARSELPKGFHTSTGNATGFVEFRKLKRV